MYLPPFRGVSEHLAHLNRPLVAGTMRPRCRHSPDPAHVAITPATPSASDPDWFPAYTVGPATMAMRDLPAPAQSLQGKWRNILKKAEKNNLDIRHQRCSPIALRELLAHDAQQQKVRAYRALPAAFTHEWQRLAPDDLRLFTAHEAGHILAQALFLRHGNTATYHIAHISERGRATSAARLLLWRSFQDFTAEGLARIDLGRIDPENAPGLARFKMGTGAKACTTGPTVLAL